MSTEETKAIELAADIASKAAGLFTAAFNAAPVTTTIVVSAPVAIATYEAGQYFNFNNVQAAAIEACGKNCIGQVSTRGYACKVNCDYDA